jgi:hypothetical protein
MAAVTAPGFKELLQRAAQAFGRVDVVFANAGFGEAKLVVDPDASRNDVSEKDRCAVAPPPRLRTDACRSGAHGLPTLRP